MTGRICLALLLICGAASGQQRRKQTGRQQTETAGAYSLPAVTFQGTLKEITGKTLILEEDDGSVVTIYRNRKTRFLRDDKPTDPKKIPEGAKLTLDVAKNPDASLLAVNVIVVSK